MTIRYPKAVNENGTIGITAISSHANLDKVGMAENNLRKLGFNIIETENDFKVEMAAPGLTKDDFTVKVTNDNLLSVTVKQEKKAEEKDKKGRYLRKEFSYAQFQQNLILPDNVDKEKIEAKVNNGVLDIIIPKVTPDKVAPVEKQIEVH